MVSFIVADRKTDYRLPPSIDDWLNQDHLARFTVDVIDQLDLSKLTLQYAGRGSKTYRPATLLRTLLYGYATGVFSSRRLEQVTYDSVAFRFIAANLHPDHDSLVAFRRRFLDELSDLFLQIFEMAKEMKLLQVGNIYLDGTKMEANASRHSALSHGHIEKLEIQLKAEVQELLALAEQADQADIPTGVDLAEELKRREEPFAAMASRQGRDFRSGQGALSAREGRVRRKSRPPRSQGKGDRRNVTAEC